ncbi:hypothetical protein [Endozoicomonas elysicola]|nr:hypothetical protein [Endozoicomonas elysicola]
MKPVTLLRVDEASSNSGNSLTGNGEARQIKMTGLWTSLAFSPATFN